MGSEKYESSRQCNTNTRKMLVLQNAVTGILVRAYFFIFYSPDCRHFHFKHLIRSLNDIYNSNNNFKMKLLMVKVFCLMRLAPIKND